MKNQIKIASMGLIIIACSFVPELFPNFFGDWLCLGSGDQVIHSNYFVRCNYGVRSFHDPTWHWGYRHWILCLTGFILVVYNVFDMVNKSESK